MSDSAMPRDLRVPQSVFHYTSAEGLLGIVDGRQLWVTDIEFLNDSQEMRYAINLLRESLTAIEPNEQPEGQALSRLASTLVQRIDARYPAEGDFQDVWERRPYVVSFCEDGDLLSMWRSYGAGPGYAVEFDTAATLTAFDTPTHQFDPRVQNVGLSAQWLPIRYGEDYAREVTENVLGELAATQSDHPGIIADSVLDHFVQEFAGIKHPAFREEGEVRLLVFHTGDLAPVPQLRASRGHLVPYHPIAIFPDFIRSITVGPGPLQARSKAALERHLLTGAGERWAHLEIRLSDAPLLY